MPNFFTIYEDKKILGSPEVDGTSLERWLLSKGVKPEYTRLASLFVEEGRSMGVRGDIALCQSIVETGWFWKNNTHFDVDPKQNNFAGIGAVGGGVPGDSFPSALIGIQAQIQSLAMRAGVKVAVHAVISQHDKKNYDTITGYGHSMWKQLAGTWAADLTYWTQIQGIMADYNKWHDANPDEVTPPAPTRMHVVYANSTKGQKILDSFVDYAPMDFVKLEVLNNTDPKPTEPPATKTLVGKIVFLDVGHGITGDQTYDSGALGPNSVQEHKMNILQAVAAKEYLESRGCTVKMGLYTEKGTGVSLEARGKKSAGCHCFVSCHFNATDKKVEYTAAFVRTSPSELDTRLGNFVAGETCKVKGEKSHGAAPWTNYSVLMGAASVGTPACISEACFIDSPGEVWPDDAPKFGKAIGVGIEKFLLSL